MGSSAWLQSIGSRTWQNIRKICKWLWLSRWETTNHISPAFSNLFYFCQNRVLNLDLCFLSGKSGFSGQSCHPRCRSDLSGDAVDPGLRRTVAFEGAPLGWGYGSKGEDVQILKPDVALSFQWTEKADWKCSSVGVGVGTGQRLALS